QTSSEVVRTMLRMSEVTTASGASHTQPLSSNEVGPGKSSGILLEPEILRISGFSGLGGDIFRSLPAGYNIGKQVLDQYLALLADDPVSLGL
ncbi:hypothetical protein EK904_006747, partial [Melospiza melodia maxima]